MHNIIGQKPSQISQGNHFRFNYLRKNDITDKTILDIGCGYGWFELLAIKNGVKKIVGTELTEKDLSTVKKHLKDKKADFRVGNAVDLGIDDLKFDTVVSWEVLEHIPADTEVFMFKEISKVLKKGGRFYMSTPHRHWLSNLFDPAWLLTFGKHRHYTRKQIASYAEEAGLEVVKIEVYGGLVTLASFMNMYVSKWIFRRPPMFHAWFEKRVAADLKAGGNKIGNIYAVFEKR